MVFAVAGQEFKVTSPGRVLYPLTGTTKSEVIRYYADLASFMRPHMGGRPGTSKRWPEGVDRDAFFVKDLEPGTPAWLTRVQIRHRSEPKFYPVFDSPAALAWLGQVAALELHVPQWRIEQPARTVATTRATERYPDRVVFDLDPGHDAGLAECVENCRGAAGEVGRPRAAGCAGHVGLSLGCGSLP